MTGSSDKSPNSSRDAWAAKVAALDAGGPGGGRKAPRARKEPITTGRIVDTAFRLVEADGFEALTMRRVAAALKTGPASLYGHVRNKAELDDLLIGELSARVTLPTPDASAWRTQIIDVCTQLRDEFLRYPGLSRAALATEPTSLDTLRLSEGMLGILLAGGVPAQSAAWAIDSLYLYVSAYAFEASLRRRGSNSTDERILGRAETIDRFRMLPTSRFPNTVAHASELTAGEGHERFDFTLELILHGLEPEPS